MKILFLNNRSRIGKKQRKLYNKVFPENFKTKFGQTKNLDNQVFFLKFKTNFTNKKLGQFQ